MWVFAPIGVATNFEVDAINLAQIEAVAPAFDLPLDRGRDFEVNAINLAQIQAFPRVFDLPIVCWMLDVNPRDLRPGPSTRPRSTSSSTPRAPRAPRWRAGQAVRRPPRRALQRRAERDAAVASAGAAARLLAL